MSCADCDRCKADIARYLKAPLRIITSAAGNNPDSLEDLRTVIFNANSTPMEHVNACLMMLFAHLSAGDQSNFDPSGPLPSYLRKHEQKAVLSVAGIFALLHKYEFCGGRGTGPIEDLINHWPKIRKWIHHLLYRALTRKASPSVAPITFDELHFAKMGDNWTMFNMVSVIFIEISNQTAYFKSVLANDGSFTLILKLWARLVRSPSTPIPHRTRDTFLLIECLQVAMAKGDLHSMQTQLLREVNGDANAVATFIIKPIRDAANASPSLSDFESDDQLLGSSILLLDKLLGGAMGGLDEKPSIFGPAFLNDPNTNPRPLIISILAKYSGLCREPRHDLPQSLREIFTSLFEICITLLWHEGSTDFVVQLLDGGILDTYANFVPSLSAFSKNDLTLPATLLKQNIAPYLSHPSVISAAKNALHRLEKERKSDYEALAKSTEPCTCIRDAWQYFKGYTFERAALKGVYDAKFRKEDKMSCNSCHVRMNEKKLFKCSGCKSVLYCSKDCQARSWKEHKKVCKVLARNLEVYKTKLDTKHFIAHLVRTDIRRHLPGLNAIAQRNPRTRGHDALLAYSVDYRSAPPVFSVFPASNLVDNGVEQCNVFDPASQVLRRELFEKVRDSYGSLRVVEAHMRGHAHMPAISMHFIDEDDFAHCSSPVLPAFNPERPRGANEDGKPLAVQCDNVDFLMVDAIYGRTLPHDEFHLYMQDFVHLGSDDQEKTVFERVEDAVKRRKDQNEAPCCRDHSGHSI